MPINQIFARLAESAISGSRSTVLKPILTLDGLLLLAASALRFQSSAPAWLPLLFGVAFAISFVVTIGAYIFFMFKDPDCLRSESYTLQKMAIERGIIGDNLQGIAEPRLVSSKTVDSVARIASESGRGSGGST